MENKRTSENWISEMKVNKPIIIAGPCSAETQSQVLTIAHLLKDINVSVLRAGVWKPRTRPGHFEGVGEVGLKWLSQAKAETGLLTATEVANAKHVELALAHDIDILWIGARSTVSPFIVQEIADALAGTEKTVLVKNPVNPDLSLWLGAVERLHRAGIYNLGVIHRGFSTTEKSKYRNSPEWQIPQELQKLYPDLPIICDPSHIAGNRDYVSKICQQAMDYNYDGLIVETHHDPENAWSDAAQQITPDTLGILIKNLILNSKNEGSFQQVLARLRDQIDLLDNQILFQLGKRMDIAKEIGILKKENNSSILKSARWNEVKSNVTLRGAEVGLCKSFVSRVFENIHSESIKYQKKTE